MNQNKPIVAIMYDFDKTLSTKDMQEYSFIPSLKMSASEFWQQSEKLARENNMDYILATMLLMLKKSREDGIDISRESLKKHGESIEFHNGLSTWFDRINSYGNTLGLDVKHYIISCGLKPMILGSGIAGHFSNIFACDFAYQNDIPVWPAMAINYSSKIQFMYRISKGVEEIYEHERLNKRLKDKPHPVPFSNMIYIGDGFTDVPCMKLTRLNGGYSVGVFSDKAASKYLIDDGRVDFYLKADYTENSELEKVTRAILDKISTFNRFKTLSQLSYTKGTSEVEF